MHFDVGMLPVSEFRHALWVQICLSLAGQKNVYVKLLLACCICLCPNAKIVRSMLMV